MVDAVGGTPPRRSVIKKRGTGGSNTTDRVRATAETTDQNKWPSAYDGNNEEYVEDRALQNLKRYDRHGHELPPEHDPGGLDIDA